VRSGDDIGIFYDPMIAKISVHGKDRAEAVKLLHTTLAQTAVFCLITNLPLLRGIAWHPDFATGAFDTGFIARELTTLLAHPPLSAPVVAAAVATEWAALADPDYTGPWQPDGWRLGASAGRRLVARDASGTEHPVHVTGNAHRFTLHWDGSEHAVTAARNNGPGWTLTLDDKSYAVRVLHQGADYQVALDDMASNFRLTLPFTPHGEAVADTATHPVSPMPGRVVAVHVKAGDRVEIGQPLLVLEGMKMEYTVKAGVTGHIENVLYREGETVDAEAPLVNIAADT